MKTLLKSTCLILIILTILVGCKQTDLYNPDDCFSKNHQTSIISQSVRYATKLPPQATHQTKFNKDFDSYYDAATTEFDIRRCYRITDTSYYFLITRKARSIWPAREAIGGKIEIDSQYKLLNYEEIFRTWKMAEDSLNTRAFELFDLMVKGKDLKPFQSRYKGDRYIEFPDDRFYFDKNERRWHDKELDSLKIN